MANRTVKDARTVKGTNPQYLVEKIIRTRIYESKYWKEECFALSGVYIVLVCIVEKTIITGLRVKRHGVIFRPQRRKRGSGKVRGARCEEGIVRGSVRGGRRLVGCK